MKALWHFGPRVLVVVACMVTAGYGDAQRSGNIYMWRNELQSDANIQELMSCWVPDTAAVVKGFFFLGSWGGCPGADGRPWAMHDTGWQQFAAEFGFGLMGVSHMCGYEYNPKNTAFLRVAIAEVAAVGPNYEIANVPLIPWGASNSGSSGYSLVNLMPEKILCAWLDVPARFDPGTPTEGGLRVPTVLSTGETDFNRDAVGPVTANARSRGGLWAWMEVEDMGHMIWRVYHVGRAFFEKCIALRYPPDADPRSGPVQLLDIDETSGWLTDDTWRTEHFPALHAYADYPGDKNSAQWHIDEEIAFMSRGLASWNDRVMIEMYVDGIHVEWNEPNERPMMTRPGATARIAMFTNGFAWDRIEIYHGPDLMHEITTGAPEHTFTIQEGAVAQTFAMIAYGGNDVQSDMPHGVVVIDDGSAVATRQGSAVHKLLPTHLVNAPVSYDLRGRVVRADRSASVGGVVVQRLPHGGAGTALKPSH